MKRRSFLELFPVLLLAPAGFCSPMNPNFSGAWKQSNQRCVPQRTGDVTLHIDHRDPELTIETTIVRNSGESRHAAQRYTTDGKVSVSTGADGDEFHTSVIWENQSLIFSVEEHEDGRILLSKERWSLAENQAVLERVRQSLNASADHTRNQTLIYLRQMTQS